MFNLSPVYSARKLSNHKLSINHKISPDTNLHKTSFFGCKKLCALHLESKYYAQNKSLLHSSLSTFECAVIPSELMNRGWKYPLKSLGRGEGTPWKERKLGALLKQNWIFKEFITREFHCTEYHPVPVPLYWKSTIVMFH